ncbi:hydrocephalus-inducing protein homolog isoform X3 [Lepisosteus oculatus]|uniref:hydrocephalus-inducing protein homolog isoform X3 n=1 Tax=Lepisosteus oculatus TaxID=7918 RepID=UPI0035F50AEF
MLTSKALGPPINLQSLSPKMPEGFKSKVVAPRNPKLVKQQDKHIKMTPSAFIKEMALTTEQRLANTYEMNPPRIIELLDMSETTHQKFSTVDIDQAMFQPFPSEIVFQNYTPCETYEVPLVLRNNDKIPRLVKVVQQDSPYFRIISPLDVCNKVAPGMASTFTILFTPEQNKDYSHKLVCITEREKFEVPIRAIGARAILDFPDHLNFSLCPVKFSSQKTLLVRNIGNNEARFQLSTESPFSVEPHLGTLGIGESTQFTVSFFPKTVGDHSQDLVLHYDTGEDIYISLYGAATDINVRLDKNSVIVEKTYITMANQRSIALINRSDIVVHFQWKTFATEEEEDQQKLRFRLDLQREEEEETDSFLAECDADPTIRDRLSILSRTFLNRRRRLQEDRLTFSDDFIALDPLEGDIWPNSAAEVNIIFKPKEAKIYQQTVYCDITGRESRLPLRIKGEGIGPKLQFSFDQLDMGNIFVASKHSYEVLLTNQGRIDATFSLVPPSSALGACFSFSPSEGTVPPGGCQAMEVTFSSSILGAFYEEFFFSIKGNPQGIAIIFRGCVMGPTFHFSVPELNFGDVSFGFPHTLTCCLNNTSLVPMTFTLRVPGDGSGEASMTSASQVSDMNRTTWANFSQADRPREFTVTPSNGTVRAQGLTDIQVTLCSNTVQCYELALVVDVQAVGEEVLALPIIARCVIPALRLETPVLDFHKCFLGYPYQKTVKLMNNSDLPACYGLLSQEYEEFPALLYSSPHPRGILEPHSMVEVPLIFQAKAKGRLETVALIAVFGSEEPPLGLHLSCIGEGPVVHVKVTEVDFGSIPVLTDITRTLQLSNQSPIPARFLAQMVRNKSQWRPEPSEGEVPAEGVMEIRLVAHLDDTVCFQDKLHLAIENSQTHSIPVSAMGTGTTIVTDRPFAPALNMGAHFSSGPCRYHFRITNRGRRPHQLYWMTEGFPQFRRRPPPFQSSSKDNRHRNPVPVADQDTPVFTLHPLRAELQPGQTVDMLLEGSTHVPKVVREKLICQAIIGKQSGKERIMTVDVTCEFIAPVLDISSKQLSFYVEKRPAAALAPLYKPLLLKNVSSLPLTVQLALREPFALCDRQGDRMLSTSKSLVLGVGEQVEVWVRFEPSYKPDRVTRVVDEILGIHYLQHPQKDCVALRGEVHFPNLHFSSTMLDFGCILNHTEAERHLTMVNCSPLPVSFRWSFLVDSEQHQIRFPQEERPSDSQLLLGEENRDLLWNLLVKGETDSRVDSNRETEVPKLTFEEDKEDKEKTDPEYETKEGIGSPKDPVSSVSLCSLSAEQAVVCTDERLLPSQSQEFIHTTLYQQPEEKPPVGVEEVFDILPLYGVLQPNESQQVSFTFYGHAGISGQVLALCEVEEGPVYEITLKGEASLVTYSFDRTEIDYGLQLFDHVAEAEITLKNTGKAGFEFNTLLSQQSCSPAHPRPGIPLVIPSSGFIPAYGEQKLSVYYLPGVPEIFDKSFEIQVSYYEPDIISLKGEGIFPRISLDLPRNLTIDHEKYSSILREAKESLENDTRKEEAFSRSVTAGADLSVDEYIPSYDTLLQMEVERLLVKEHSVEQEELLSTRSQVTGTNQWWRKKLGRFLLPEYILDFGYVIHGSVCTHIAKVTNTGPLPVSFKAERRPLTNTGFSTELDKVKNLPYCETETFEVKFDPRGADLDLGEVSTLMPIQVAGGPTFPVRLCAVVTMPSLAISTDTLNFGSVQCGLCRVMTIQLHNHLQVTCRWSVSEPERQKKKIDKYVPLHLRRKAKQELRSAPQVFEMLPPTGELLPGERVNVQVKFSPTEGAYSQRLTLCIAQSSQRVMLLAQGHGEEPQLEFSSSVLELGPILPYSNGDKAEVVVRNPCAFPVEFYSLEFDKQYLEEEKILRMLKGYDSQNFLLLPPRAPGEKLPPEILDYYEEQRAAQEERSRLEEDPKTSEDALGLELEEKRDPLGQEEEDVPLQQCDRVNEDGEEETGGAPLREKAHGTDLSRERAGSGSSIGVGELEDNPVSKAIARHMGIDLSPEGQASRNRRGIAIIVHGAPLSGKTRTAVTLAKHYGAACLSIDAVVLEAVSNGNSATGLRARELCARAAQEQAQRRAEETAQAVSEVIGAGTQDTGFLSVEAVTKHASEGSQNNEAKAGPQSAISVRNKASTVGGKGKAESSQTQKQQSSEPTVNSQSTAAPAHSGLPQRRLSVSASVAGELGLLSCVLPDELLVDILAERLQLNDCHRGVVFDGLETLYSRSPSSALQALLKAFNNRRYIYLVNLIQDYNTLKAKEKSERDEEERLLQERIEMEKARMKEMDEEEYDALSEGEREHIDLKRLEDLRERKRREQERLAQELEERRQQEELERLREEEEMRKKSKKGRKEPSKEEAGPGKKSQLAGKQVSSLAGIRSETRVDQAPGERKLSYMERPESMPTERSDPEEGNKKKKAKEGRATGQDLSPPPLASSEETEKDQADQREKALLLRFRLYEQSQRAVSQVARFWDRVQGQLVQLLTQEDAPQEAEDNTVPERQAPSGKKGKKEKQEKEKAEKDRQEREKVDRLKVDADPKLMLSPVPSQTMEGESFDGGEREEQLEGSGEVGVPYIPLQVSGKNYPSGTEILKSGKLPPLDEVLDGLGLGTRGPPIPPPTIFSVVPYPKKRPPLSTQEILSHFTFIVSAPEDTVEDKKDTVGAETELDALGSISFIKEESATPSKGRGKKEKTETGRESQKDKRRAAVGSKKGSRGSESRSPPLIAVTPLSDTEQSSRTAEPALQKTQRLTHFRWTVPPHGEMSLKVWFNSTVSGQFDQTLNFEILGTRRRYQLYCRGVCAFPAISKDAKTVFAHCKKALALQPGETLQKTYIFKSQVFEFGPLLCGKTRDRYKERKYPENTEKLIVHNNSPLDAEVFFCFQHDTKATTFLLDPPSMTLRPNEKQELTVWAYPTSPGVFEDSVVCCVRENPEPVLFRITCRGVRPELDIDRKQLHFDKILLHRKDTKSLYLRNSTLLPVAWRLSGLEVLGDEFTVSQDQGIIQPQSEFSLQMHFRAMKPVNLKRAIRLEVSDVENILGIVHTENIQIIAEAYDVALDMSFPRGADGGLDFGLIKVSEEVKLSVNLKNKGKYEIVFHFVLEATEPDMPDLTSLFTITPQKGSLNPSDRPTTVQIVFRSNKEVSIKDKPILRCQVIEPNVAEGGETIASIPVKVSIQSLFTKYSISPANDINFGALVYGSRKLRTFTIENKGEFELRYTIFRMSKDVPPPTQKKGAVAVKRARSREGSCSGKSVPVGKLRRSESVQKEMGTSVQARFSTGMFTVSPGFGPLAPGTHQIITVECVADQVGKCEEYLAIDISDRDPSDQPNGISYRLVAEGCIPGIVVNDIASIFEEHRICKNSSLFQFLQISDCTGIYIEDENKFLFCNVLVGRQAKARFKIINTGRVPCDLSLAVRPVSAKVSGRISDVFEVDPVKLCVPSHSHAFVVATFTPQSMQNYQAVFEASVEGVLSSSPMVKTKALVFDIAGDGNLPRVSVLRPTLRNHRGSPLLLFRRLLLGRTQKLPLLLMNDSSVPAQINIDLLDETGDFTVKSGPNTSCGYVGQSERHAAHTASLILTPGQQAEFSVVFSPAAVQSYDATVRILVVDNQYEETVVQLLGEGYQDQVTLDNIHSTASTEATQLDQDNLEVYRSDILHFGDCHVGRAYQESFTMTNHSSADVLRFEWPLDSPQLKFSPQVGHLHAGCSKDITVTFHSEQPVALSARLMKCKLCRIGFQQPVDQVPDWDDRMRTVKWVDVGRQAALPHSARRKVIETDPEPVHAVIENSSHELELRVSAVCDYAQFKCKTETIRFKDTLLFQTRVFEIQMTNEGNVQLEFSWQVLMERCGKGVGFIERHTDSDGVSSTQTPGSRLSSSIRSRPASALERVSSLLAGDPDVPPFSVEPSAGAIAPGSSQAFRIKFSPLEVAESEGRLVCSIPNLKDGQGPTMAVSGRSLLPYCHFDLEDSDYISSSRRNPELRGPQGAPPRATLDPNTRVLEFTSVGITTTTSRVFSIMNPTSSAYSFLWRCEDSEEFKLHSPFRCITDRGTIQPGKKVEVAFEFMPLLLESIESFWFFLIPEQSISVPFLLVGTSREPAVCLDRSYLNYGCLLIGREAHETVYMVNSEDTAFQFSFQESSRHSKGYTDSLIMEPMEGTVPPRSRSPVVISFTPTQEGNVNFNLVCDVKRKTQPLTLNVKAEGYSMSANVQCESPDGLITELSPSSVNEISFKQVETNDKLSCYLLVSNPGQFGLDVLYELLGPQELLRYLQVAPERCSVAAGRKSQCTLTFNPLHKCVLKNTGLKIKIKNGPVFNCFLSGSAVAPGVHFSFTTHNFGINFIYHAGMVPCRQTLVITNKGERGASLECLFTNMAHLEVGFQAGVLPPGGVMEVPITFYPREAIRYQERITFEINGYTHHSVEILGQGTEMKVEVENPKHKVVSLGALQVGQKAKRVIPVVNKSHAPLTCSVVMNPTLQALLDPKVLSVRPSGDITLKANGGQCSVEVVFSPKHRVPSFAEEVMLECGGTSRSLFVLRGCCQGMKISLDQDYLPFGTVLLRCQATRRILMQNTGDIGASFKWDLKRFAPHFSINPVEGYISPGMEVSFEVTFAPQEQSQDMRYDDLPCAIEGGQPLRLTLTGSCASAPVTKEVVGFVCQVRTQQTQSIVLWNRTNQRLSLKPVIEGEHWSGPPSFVIEPHQQNKAYEVTYRPLVMTADGRKHQGSVFFSYPDGTGMLYALQGTSEPPKAAGTISRDVPAKTSYTELLPVANWLPKPQRFRAIVETLKPDKTDITTTLKGLDFIDVPALAKRDYKLTFFSYKEGVFNGKVTFRNEITQEYLFYYVNFKATAPGIMKTIEMVTPVRQSHSATVTVENPLPTPLSFTTECKSTEISVPSQLTVPAQSEGTLTFEYQPLRVGESTSRLTLLNGELGNFHYELLLKALPAGKEKALFFRATLGNGQYLSAKFINYSRVKAEYSCKIDSPDFTVEKNVNAAPGFQGGMEVSVEVYFEPSQLGETRGLLTLSSAFGGEYFFPLFGTCTLPKAQGPFTIRAGSNVSIPFKNVFQQTTAFSFQVDNPAFTVKGMETIRPKKTHNILVSFEGGPAGPRAPVNGKLTISCPRAEGHGQIISWVYYLKGHTPEPGPKDKA